VNEGGQAVIGNVKPAPNSAAGDEKMRDEP
jgi:hypothetical protein